MHLTAGKVNKRSLQQLLDAHTPKATHVLAAIAYCESRQMELLKAARAREVPLTLYCRYDRTVPVSPEIFDWFAAQNSPSYLCKVVPEELHAKVIWWKGVGAYVGSANLSHNAWHTNIEAGIFATEADMAASGMLDELTAFFGYVDSHAYAVTNEFRDHYRQMAKEHQKAAEALTQHLKAKPLFFLPVETHDVGGKGPSIMGTSAHAEFKRDWGLTLTSLRTIASRVSTDTYRPAWIPENTSPGAQADQFLHSFFYHQCQNSDGAIVGAHNRNMVSPEAALIEAMIVWKQADYDFESMRTMLTDSAQELRSALSKSRLLHLSKEDFVSAMSKLNAVQDHGRWYSGQHLGTGEAGKSKSSRVEAALTELWGARSKGGLSALEVLDYVIWGSGPVEDRIWKAHLDPYYKINQMGLSTLSEAVGWALPDEYPPRNERTKKALYGLGYPIEGLDLAKSSKSKSSLVASGAAP